MFFVRGFGCALFIWEEKIMDNSIEKEFESHEEAAEASPMARCREAMDKLDDLPLRYSLKHKRWGNRYFREVVLMPDHIPFPEADTAFERFKSRFFVFINLPLGRRMPVRYRKQWHNFKKQLRLERHSRH